MVAEANDEERLAGKVAAQALDEVSIVLRTDRLAPKILVGLGIIAEIAPAGHQIGTETIVPREVVCSRIGEEEQRCAPTLTRDDVGCCVIEEMIGFDAARTKLLHVEEMLDAGRHLEAAGAEKAPKYE